MSENETTSDAKVTDKEITPERAFILNNGEQIKNIQGLYQKLQGMDQTVFAHHANEERNDFGNWVKDVHKDYRLANSLFSAKTREECAKAVGDHLYSLQNSIEQENKSIALDPKDETAAERLEKILCEAVKRKTRSAKITDEDETGGFKKDLLKLEEIKALPAPKEAASSVITAQELIETAAEVDESPEELIRFTEEKSFVGQFKDEMASLFSSDSLITFKDDLNKLFSIGTKKAEEQEPHYGVEPKAAAKVKALAKLPVNTKTDDRIIAHLKKVYR
ncbi:MAG: hypothetical protein V1729_01490 [Candidatus Woesearchaeota archaeon]